MACGTIAQAVGPRFVQWDRGAIWETSRNLDFGALRERSLCVYGLLLCLSLIAPTKNLSAGGSMYPVTGSRLHKSGTCGPNVVTATKSLSAGGSMYLITGSRPIGFAQKMSKCGHSHSKPVRWRLNVSNNRIATAQKCSKVGPSKNNHYMHRWKPPPPLYHLK